MKLFNVCANKLSLSLLGTPVLECNLSEICSIDYTDVLGRFGDGWIGNCRHFSVMSPNVSTFVNWTDNSLIPAFLPQKSIKLLWRCLAAALQTRLCGFSILFKYSKRHFPAVNALACNINISVVSRVTRWPVFHRSDRYFAANLAEAGKKPVF